MSHNDFINDLMMWIDNHIEGKMNLDTVSQRAGYSKWHLQRMFKEYTGHPLGEYIRAHRLKKSAERLLKGDEPIIDVAISFGYDSQQSCQANLHLKLFWQQSHPDFSSLSERHLHWRTVREQGINLY